MSIKRKIAIFLAALAAVALNVAPSAPAAAQSTASYSAELNQLTLDMRALWGELDRFQPRTRYCLPPDEPNKRQDQATLDGLEARVKAMNARYTALKQGLNTFLANNPRLYAELMVNNIDPGDRHWWARYDASQKKMNDELARKKAALARAPEVNCSPKPKPKPVTVGTTGARPASQGVARSPLPTRPSIDPLGWPVMPAFFCNWEDYWKFINEVINPRYEKAAENAEKAAKFRSEIEQQVNDHVQNDRPVPTALQALRRQAIADVAAQNRLFQEAEEIRGRAKAIPVIDCSKQGTQTGAATSQTSIDQQDAHLVRNQQQWIAGIETDIAKLEPLRLAGNCTELNAEAELIRREISEMSRVAMPRSDGTRGLFLPPQVIAELKRRLAAATQPCPPRTQTTPSPGLSVQDTQQAARQLKNIEDVEAAIAELKELRKTGQCGASWEAANDLDEWLNDLSRPGGISPINLTARPALPSTLIDKWDDQIDDIMDGCPKPNRIDPRIGTPVPIYIPSKDSVEWRILDIHNKERAAVGSPSLGWDPQLAAAASAYAVKLAAGGPFVHAPRAGRESERENLSRGLPGASAERMMINWTGEKGNFTPGTYPNVSKTGNWSDVSHYTQMIWPTTTRVGCGTAGGSKYAVLVCRYTPPGNQPGRQVPADRRELGKLPVGGGMQQIDPPPPPRPTAADEAPGGVEAQHPLATFFAGALNRHYEALRNCDRAADERALDEMRYAIDELRKRLKAAKSVGGMSAINPDELQRLIDGLERVVRGAGQRTYPGTCPPR
ncbi:MAG: CAP domain-containing protein [Sphingomicrobium sp.]